MPTNTMHYMHTVRKSRSNKNLHVHTEVVAQLIAGRSRAGQQDGMRNLEGRVLGQKWTVAAENGATERQSCQKCRLCLPNTSQDSTSTFFQRADLLIAELATVGTDTEPRRLGCARASARKRCNRHYAMRNNKINQTRGLYCVPSTCAGAEHYLLLLCKQTQHFSVLWLQHSALQTCKGV